MTLKKHLILIIAAHSILGAASAEEAAYVVPGRGPGRPAPAPYPGPHIPGNPGTPIPRYPGDDFGRGRVEQKSAYVQRRFVNQQIALRQLLGIDERYRGYTVESVIVDVRGSGANASLDLEVNNSREDSARSPRGRLELRPRLNSEIGRDVQSLQLRIRGVVDIDMITVNLREGRHGGGDFREINLPLFVSRRMLGADRLDLTRAIDMNRYRGYRVTAVDIDARAVHHTATLGLLINGFGQGQALTLGPYPQLQSIYLQNTILGQGAESLVLYSMGDLDVRAVNLRLIRR